MNIEHRPANDERRVVTICVLNPISAWTLWPSMLDHCGHKGRHSEFVVQCSSFDIYATAGALCFLLFDIFWEEQKHRISNTDQRMMNLFVLPGHYLHKGRRRTLTTVTLMMRGALRGS